MRLLKVEEMKIKCPICDYELGMCQCLFAGDCHPDRTKIREVVLDHLYLLTDEQIKHVQYLERYWKYPILMRKRKLLSENWKMNEV